MKWLRRGKLIVHGISEGFVPGLLVLLCNFVVNGNLLVDKFPNKRLINLQVFLMDLKAVFVHIFPIVNYLRFIRSIGPYSVDIKFLKRNLTTASQFLNLLSFPKQTLLLLLLQQLILSIIKVSLMYIVLINELRFS